MKQKIYVYLLVLACSFSWLTSSEKWHSEKVLPVEVKIPNFNFDFSMAQLANPWKDSKVICTEKFPLMGKQMGVVETIGIEPLGYELDGEVKVFHLVAQPLEKLIVDEKSPDLEKVIPEINKIVSTHLSPRYQRVKCWGYNGSSPGPTLEATEGDRVRIILKNELPEPTSIHWHGFEIPSEQDGATY